MYLLLWAKIEYCHNYSEKKNVQKMNKMCKKSHQHRELMEKTNAEKSKRKEGFPLLVASSLAASVWEIFELFQEIDKCILVWIKPF